MWLGGLKLATLIAFLASVYGPLSRAPAALLLTASAVLAFRRIDVATRRLVIALALAGAAATVWAVHHGAEFDPVAMAAINLPIIALFLGVAFLSLVGAVVSGGAVRPARGLGRTIAAIHFIGAIINMSMVAIAGDRMARDGTLGRREAILLARCYTAAAFWSPFFVAAAVAHTYAPAADARLYLPLGVLGAIAACVLTAREVRRLDPAAPLPVFAPDRAAIRLTVSLLVAALLLKALVPEVAMVVVVSTVTPPLALLMLPRGTMIDSARSLLGSTLPATASQVVLFYSAGLFAYGVSSLIAVELETITGLPESVPVWAYPLVTLTIVAAAYLGLHPVISIAAISSLLLPLGVDQSLLAFGFLAGWAVGTAVAPLSGMNLFLIARYRLRPRQIAGWGWHYSVSMLVVVTLLTLLGHLVQQWGWH